MPSPFGPLFDQVPPPTSPEPTADHAPAAPAATPSPPSADPAAHPVFEQALAILRAQPAPDTPSSPRASGAPEPIPARMLNEFVYCPRLFYYEYVEGVFVESADTVRGAALHRRVDAGKGDLPPAARAEAKSRANPKNTQSSTGTPTSRPADATPEPASAPGTAPGTQSPAADADEENENGDEIIHSRSVTLGSERLGVVAKLDLVEVRGDGTEAGQGELFRARFVVPVDYKAAAPREGADANELWPTDQMQLGLQILLLRDNGYGCEEGVIYYRATKQRVRFVLTPERETWVRDQIEQARRTMSGPIPPPLVASPKCPRCSLAPVCLPDETLLLAHRASETDSVAPVTTRVPPPARDGIPALPPSRGLLPTPSATTAPGSPPAPSAAPRRLIAARDDQRALYLNTPGLRVGRRDETLTVKDEDVLLDEVRFNDLSHVALFGNIQITTQAIQGLCDAEIPVTYFSGGGWFYGLTHGHGLKNVFLRIEQFRLARDPAFALRLARAFVHGKIRNHRTLLMRNHVEAPAPALNRLRQSALDALAATSLEELLGIEGAAAAAYFEHFGGMLKVAEPLDGDEIPGVPSPPRPAGTRELSFDFATRHRRPPTDPVNALLSLAYSVLAKDCTIAAAAVGFDPYVGFYHQPRFGRPALALDLMEEFRALIAESAVLTAINNRSVSLRDFVSAGQAVNLTPSGRKKFFLAYEQRMTDLLTHPLFDYKVSYRRALELQARILGKTLTGEIPDYVPLTTR